MKEIKQYVASVDSHRKNGLVCCPADERLYQRQSRGRYRVAAKSEKEAKKLVQQAIKFGSVSIVYEDSAPGRALPYRSVKRELPDGRLVGAVPATAPAAGDKMLFYKLIDTLFFTLFYPVLYAV